MTLSTIERVLFLKRAKLFALTPGEDLLAAAVAEEVSFSAGTTFIRQDDLGDCLYVVVHGEAGIDIRGVGRIATRGPQSVIGELSIISRGPRSADCIALTDVTALRIDYESFWELPAERPQLAQGVI